MCTHQTILVHLPPAEPGDTVIGTYKLVRSFGLYHQRSTWHVLMLASVLLHSTRAQTGEVACALTKWKFRNHVEVRCVCNSSTKVMLLFAVNCVTIRARTLRHLRNDCTKICCIRKTLPNTAINRTSCPILELVWLPSRRYLAPAAVLCQREVDVPVATAADAHECDLHSGFSPLWTRTLVEDIYKILRQCQTGELCLIASLRPASCLTCLLRCRSAPSQQLQHVSCIHLKISSAASCASC